MSGIVGEKYPGERWFDVGWNLHVSGMFVEPEMVGRPLEVAVE